MHFIYAAIQSVFPDGSFNPGNAVNYTKSTDFGRSWNTLASIEDQLSALPKYFVDRPTITSNPFKPNVLYAVWGNVLGILIDPTTLSQTFELQISHDSGNTWSSPRTIATLQPGVLGQNAILQILPDSTAVIIYQANNLFTGNI